MRRINRERRQHGKHFARKILIRLVALGFRQRFVGGDDDAFARQRRQDIFLQAAHLLQCQRLQTTADFRQLLGRGQAVERRLFPSVLDLFFQSGHPHHEKLVNDAREDDEKAKPLEQRIAIVTSFVQNLTKEFD